MGYCSHSGQDYGQAWHAPKCCLHTAVCTLLVPGPPHPTPSTEVATKPQWGPVRRLWLDRLSELASTACAKLLFAHCWFHTAVCRATPPHPEYLSGHQAAVWAIADTLVRTLGKDDVTFSFTSDSTPWITRTYKSITAAAKEVGGAHA